MDEFLPRTGGPQMQRLAGNWWEMIEDDLVRDDDDDDVERESAEETGESEPTTQKRRVESEYDEETPRGMKRAKTGSWTMFTRD